MIEGGVRGGWKVMGSIMIGNKGRRIRGSHPELLGGRAGFITE